ncbi:Phytochrome-like protein cph2 [Ensifer sp. M14]|uniref:diguanylate cyclase n=1 Tax=Ensifer sp. M14 TaxID=2203782 RepID=UPI000E2D924D|nr:diguanylate cyclase [Ensifer sp. M14]RDL47620.1 Phytochrome-like protein cph2 [Ensifer sp. M14]
MTEHHERELELCQLNDRLAALASTDGLTQLPNRRAFDAALETAYSIAVEKGGYIGLLMIDVDRFKAYNDTYGHPAGDACLKKVTQAISDALAPMRGSVVARYGGEEVAVILPGAELSETLAIGGIVCAAVRALGVDHIGSEKRVVTVSIGCSAIKPSKNGTKSHLLRQADLGLYAAKAAGRDCIRIAETEQETAAV